MWLWATSRGDLVSMTEREWAQAGKPPADTFLWWLLDDMLCAFMKNEPPTKGTTHG